MIKEPVIDEVVARKFHLGQLSSEEEGQIQELAFEDPDTFTLLEAVEEDLIDEYVHDELSPLEKQHFEKHFMSVPGRRQDLQIGEMLQDRFDKIIPPDPRPPDPVRFFLRRFIDWLTAPKVRWALTAAAVPALVIFGVWLRDRTEKQSDPLHAGPGTSVNVPSPEPHVSPSLQPSPSPVHVENIPKGSTPEKQKPAVAYSFLLIPSAETRSAPGPPLDLPPDTSSVPVGLALTDPRTFKTYEAILLNKARTKIDQWSNLEEQRLAATGGFQETRGLLIPVKTALLQPDENYRIEVTGLSPEGERSPLKGYSFQAKK